LKLRPELFLFSGFGVAVFITATYASTALLKPKVSVWQLAKNNLEVQKVVKENLNLSKTFTYQQSIDAATVQFLTPRHTVYRFKSKETCGRWGCLHVVIDNLLQRQKAFHLRIPESEEESYLFIENDCATAVQTNPSRLTEKYPLCLKLN
jgi:hypothetical protein